MSISIRWRLVAGIVLAFVATLAVIFITVQFALARILWGDLDDDLTNNAARVQAEALIRPIDSPAFQDLIEGFAQRAEGRTPFITVIRDTEGDRVLSSAGVQPDSTRLTPAEYEKVLSGDTVTKTLDLPGGDEYRVRSQPLVIGREVVGIIQVAQVTEGVTGPVNTLLVILVAEGIGATILTVAVAFWLARGAVRPLERVIDVAADIQAHDLRTRINATKQPTEVQKLADTFDAMLGRLEKAFQEQEDFVLDVSHELRTPLTVLKGSIDVLLMDPELDTGIRDKLEQMSGEISRMIRLTGNLLYMAAADAGREPEHKTVELDVLCLDVVQQSRSLHHDVKLAMGREDQVSVSGDRDQIKQMVLNLVDNALKYTPAGGEVTLSVYKDGSFAEVSVRDTGPGIPPDILPHIFERFYRGDHRSLMGGTGLGLAIANRIAKAHGGDIVAESELGEGTTFVVKLPLSPESQRAEAGGSEMA